jgi:hypothetical protein
MGCVRENHLQFLLSLSLVAALYGRVMMNWERCGGQGIYCKHLPGGFEERNQENLRITGYQLAI